MTFDRWSDDDGPLRDTAAMEEIHQLLDGREWSPDTLDQIANIVRRTSREVRDCNEVDEADAIFVVMSDREFDDEGLPLFWSNTEGWTLMANATRFTEDESEWFNLPLSGYWAELAVDDDNQDRSN